MTVRRLGAALAAAGIAAALVPWIGSTPAGAATRATLTVSETTPVVAGTYGPIPGFWAPSREAVSWTPGGCVTPDTTPPHGEGPAAAVCDTVPIMVVPPNVPAETPWLIEIELSWPNPTGTNDLDMTLYDDQQVTKRANTTGYSPFGEANTQNNPERIRTYLPTLGKYNLVVLNYLGVNTSYTVKVTMKIGEAFTTPFESLDDLPPIAESSSSDSSSGDGGLSDFSAFEDFGSFSGFASLEELSILPDDTLASGDLSASGISNLPSTPTAGNFNRIAESRPGPASGVLMFIWLVLLPASVAGGAGTYIASRSRRGTLGFA